MDSETLKMILEAVSGLGVTGAWVFGAYIVASVLKPVLVAWIIIAGLVRLIRGMFDAPTSTN